MSPAAPGTTWQTVPGTKELRQCSHTDSKESDSVENIEIVNLCENEDCDKGHGFNVLVTNDAVETVKLNLTSEEPAVEKINECVANSLQEYEHSDEVVDDANGVIENKLIENHKYGLQSAILAKGTGVAVKRNLKEAQNTTNNFTVESNTPDNTKKSTTEDPQADNELVASDPVYLDTPFASKKTNLFSYCPFKTRKPIFPTKIIHLEDGAVRRFLSRELKQHVNILIAGQGRTPRPDKKDQATSAVETVALHPTAEEQLPAVKNINECVENTLQENEHSIHLLSKCVEVVDDANGVIVKKLIENRECGLRSAIPAKGTGVGVKRNFEETQSTTNNFTVKSNTPDNTKKCRTEDPQADNELVESDPAYLDTPFLSKKVNLFSYCPVKTRKPIFPTKIIHLQDGIVRRFLSRELKQHVNILITGQGRTPRPDRKDQATSPALPLHGVSRKKLQHKQQGIKQSTTSKFSQEISGKAPNLQKNPQKISHEVSQGDSRSIPRQEVQLNTRQEMIESNENRLPTVPNIMPHICGPNCLSTSGPRQEVQLNTRQEIIESNENRLPTVPNIMPHICGPNCLSTSGPRQEVQLNTRQEMIESNENRLPTVPNILPHICGPNCLSTSGPRQEVQLNTRQEIIESNENRLPTVPNIMPHICGPNCLSTSGISLSNASQKDYSRMQHNQVHRGIQSGSRPPILDSQLAADGSYHYCWQSHTGGMLSGNMPLEHIISGAIPPSYIPPGNIVSADIAPGSIVTGGIATGGIATGEIATDGIATGGIATGGIATDGIVTDVIATGGLATGGLATGGLATGGLATGGIDNNQQDLPLVQTGVVCSAHQMQPPIILEQQLSNIQQQSTASTSTNASYNCISNIIQRMISVEERLMNVEQRQDLHQRHNLLLGMVPIGLQSRIGATSQANATLGSQPYYRRFCQPSFYGSAQNFNTSPSESETSESSDSDSRPQGPANAFGCARIQPVPVNIRRQKRYKQKNFYCIHMRRPMELGLRIPRRRRSSFEILLPEIESDSDSGFPDYIPPDVVFNNRQFIEHRLLNMNVDQNLVNINREVINNSQQRMDFVGGRGVQPQQRPMNIEQIIEHRPVNMNNEQHPLNINEEVINHDQQRINNMRVSRNLVCQPANMDLQAINIDRRQVLRVLKVRHGPIEDEQQQINVERRMINVDRQHIILDQPVNARPLNSPGIEHRAQQLLDSPERDVERPLGFPPVIENVDRQPPQSLPLREKGSAKN